MCWIPSNDVFFCFSLPAMERKTVSGTRLRAARAGARRSVGKPPWWRWRRLHREAEVQSSRALGESYGSSTIWTILYRYLIVLHQHLLWSSRKLHFPLTLIGRVFIDLQRGITKPPKSSVTTELRIKFKLYTCIYTYASWYTLYII